MLRNGGESNLSVRQVALLKTVRVAYHKVLGWGSAVQDAGVGGSHLRSPELGCVQGRVVDRVGICVLMIMDLWVGHCDL